MPRSNNQKKTTAKKKATSLKAGKRKCTRCKVVFYKEKGVLKALCPECKSRCKRCNVKLTKDNFPKHLHKRKQFYCTPCLSEQNNILARKDGGAKRRDYYLNMSFGITLLEYEAMLKAQDDSCYICQRPPKEGGKRLAVDHLHSKGEKSRHSREKRGRIRGLLCWHCNSAIGKFRDNVEHLRRAADYLEEWPGQQILKEESDG